MHNFWNQIIFGNPVYRYVIVAGAILLGILFKRLISKLIAGLLYRVAKKLAPGSDKEAFVRLVIAPLETFLVIFVTVVALDKLHFPDELNVDIYEVTMKSIVHALAKILLIISFFWLLLRNIDFIAVLIGWNANRMHAVKDNQHIAFFRDFLKAIVSLLGLVMVLGLGFGLEVGRLLAGLGLVGAAIALAAKESIENLIASFIIFFDNPFTAGDLVKVNDITGNVEKIGLRSTRIRTDQKTYVTVPNKQMVDSVVDNQTLRTQRKAEIRLPLSLGTPPSTVQDLLLGISAILGQDKIENQSVFLNAISASGLQVNADYFTANISLLEFNQIKQEVNFQVLELVDKLQVQMAGTITDLRVQQEQK
jgi:MscS family membrane protein